MTFGKPPKSQISPELFRVETTGHVPRDPMVSGSLSTFDLPAELKVLARAAEVNVTVFGAPYGYLMKPRDAARRDPRSSELLNTW